MEQEQRLCVRVASLDVGEAQAVLERDDLLASRPAGLINAKCRGCAGGTGAGEVRHGESGADAKQHTKRELNSVHLFTLSDRAAQAALQQQLGDLATGQH